MLVKKIKQIAEDRDFEFLIGSEDWQNLLDAADDTDKEFKEKKVYLLLFQEKENRVYGEFGVNKDDRGVNFLLAVRSKISDASFDYKYEKHIEPLKELAREIEDVDFDNCDNFSLKNYGIQGWRENYMDTNLDCVEVQISVEYNE
ncbi:hypothetical protein [Tenacibaculum piscium]|uniref:hypothetical protein n=1 Tax=Tenacibaculum piscium TaxID=1458515 RepID=UPI001F1639A2|nr:hypothetical protein [Tenacibaculum piscium]